MRDTVTVEITGDLYQTLIFCLEVSLEFRNINLVKCIDLTVLLCFGRSGLQIVDLMPQSTHCGGTVEKDASGSFFARMAGRNTFLRSQSSCRPVFFE
jgi:hypothetical protein